MNNPDPDFEIHARGRYLSLDIVKNKQSAVLSYYSFVTQVAWISWQACKASLANKKTE